VGTQKGSKSRNKTVLFLPTSFGGRNRKRMTKGEPSTVHSTRGEKSGGGGKNDKSGQDDETLSCYGKKNKRKQKTSLEKNKGVGKRVNTANL